MGKVGILGLGIRALIFAPLLLSGVRADQGSNAPPDHTTMETKKYAANLAYHFEPCVFSTKEFPAGSFQQNAKVQIDPGQVRVETSFYNEKFQEVKTADVPGRYGAVVRITLGDGTVVNRFVALYRLPDGAPTQTINLGKVKVQMETGTDPDVAKRHILSLIHI